MMSSPALVPTRRLVIVEDEAILAMDLERHLTSVGFDVRGVAATGDDAIAMVEKERPDLVLMDIHIQGPRDGIETAKELRARFDLPVVYLTAHGDPKTIERAQATEPMGYLLKPFKKPDLQNIVVIALARTQNERALKRREEMLSTTLSCIGEAILTTDASGAVTWINPAAEQLLGCSADTAATHPVWEVVPMRPSTTGLQETVVADASADGPIHLEGLFEHPDGQHSLVGTVAALHQGTEGSFGVVVALRDLTELFRARRQLEFAERLNSMGTLAAGVAHEVNNPLSVVLSNLDWALSREDVVGELRTALAEAQDATGRVGQIVAGLRAFSRPQLDHLHPFDPREAFGAALSLTRATWRPTTAVVLDLRPSPPVHASASRLTQVFVSLIINAAQAMQTAGGSSVLTLASRTNEAGWAVLSVSDTGPGIPVELRERIFEPFFTTKPIGKGTGLGLAVARSIVQNFGGRLTVGPGAGGVGASFEISLPPTALLDDAPRPRPMVLWYGPTDPECAAFAERGTLVTTDDRDAVRRLATERLPDLFLNALPSTSLGDRVPPPLASATFAVGEAAVLPGTISVRRPIDLESLVALVRRSGP
jgi:PAS domain S-box-containing protein